MKKIKFSLLISIVLISLFVIGAASAATDDAVSAATDDVVNTATDDTVVAAGDDEVLAVDETDEPAAVDGPSSSEKSFYDLETDVYLYDELNADYKFNKTVDYPHYENTNTYESGVIIAWDCTIDGKGHYIDGDNQARIFRIDTGVNVVLKNIVFKNGKGELGSAIYSTGNLTLENCTFIGNEGQAVYVLKEQPVVSLIDDGDSYNALFNEPNSALNKYYWVAPREDGIDENGNPLRDYAIYVDRIMYGHSWDSARISAKGFGINSTFPWLLMQVDHKFKGNITIKYDGQIVKIINQTVPRVYGYILTSLVNVDSMAKYRLTQDGDKPKDESGNVLSIDPSKLEVIFNYTGGSKIVTATTSDIYKDATIAFKNVNGTINAADITYGKDAVIKGTLNLGGVDNFKDWNLLLNGNKVKAITLDENGNFEATVPGLATGTYTITFSNDDGYGLELADSVDNSFKVNKANAALQTQDVSVVFIYWAKEAVTLTSGSTPISGANVVITIDGKELKGTTDSNGKVTISIPPGFAVKTYTATVKFAGDKNYNSASKTFKLTVKKANAKISAAAAEFKATKAVKKYAITLKDSKDNVLANKKVSIKIKGITYTAYTNPKGKAVFKIDKLTKKGKHDAKVKFYADNSYNKAVKYVKIYIK